jgi:hypothetical protein
VQVLGPAVCGAQMGEHALDRLSQKQPMGWQDQQATRNLLFNRRLLAELPTKNEHGARMVYKQLLRRACFGIALVKHRPPSETSAAGAAQQQARCGRHAAVSMLLGSTFH